MRPITWLAKKQQALQVHMGLPRSSYYEGPISRVKIDESVIEVLNQIIVKNGRWGFRLCFDWMCDHGYLWNKKRVWRIYKEMGLNLPRRTKKCISKKPRIPLIDPAEANTIWSLDFMYDTLHYGRPFRTLNVIDESNREILATEIDISFPAARVVRTLEQLEDNHSLSKAMRLDNGNELWFAFVMGWCESKSIELKFIQSGKPQQNAFIERFNKTYRHEVLNAYLFENLREVREITESWITIYNGERPHSFLGRISPRDYRAQVENNTLGMLV